MRKIIFGLEDGIKLRCDALSCRYELPEKQPFNEDIIGFRCPMCGSVMVTQWDYDNARRVVGIARFMNRWLGWLGKEEPPPNTKTTRIQFKDGKINDLHE